MNNPNREELERAIERIDDLLDAIKKDGLAVRGIMPDEYKALRLSQDLIRAELSRQENAPLTWNERINQMTVGEKAIYIRGYVDCSCCPVNRSGGYRCDDYCSDNECLRKITELLNSPYTEGAANSAAEVEK